MTDYLEEAKRYLSAAEGAVVPNDADEAMLCYLAGINAALISIAEKMPFPFFSWGVNPPAPKVHKDWPDSNWPDWPGY